MMKKPKILLIEDEKVIIEFYKELFTNLASYDLEVIEQCESALRALKEIRGGKREKWDLVLLDVLLSDKSGIYFLIEARKYPETKDLKIFALTNYADPKLNKELKKEGVDKILVKTDYKPKELLQIVKEAIGK